MILPYIDYGDMIYYGACTTDLDKLQRLQNSSLKTFLGRGRRFDTDRAHREAKAPFLADRRKAHTKNCMYTRRLHRPDLLNNKQIRTRAHDAPLYDIKVPRCEAFKRSVCYHGGIEWNTLPSDVRNSNEYVKFKQLQKKEMLAPLAGLV